MKERPILFSAPMVRAILSGAKTQTRRVVNPQPRWRWRGTFFMPWPHCIRNASPYGVPGDRLWVRETHAVITLADERVDRRVVAYRASCRGDTFDYFGSNGVTAIKVARWKPSIFMPRWASRITLEVLDVRVEHLQEISEADAIEEGIECTADGYWIRYTDDTVCANPRTSYKSLWQAINGKRPGFTWDDNPWVWVLTLKRIEGGVIEHAERGVDASFAAEAD